MKELGKISTEKIERIKELMKQFDRLDDEVRKDLRALLPEGTELGFVEDSFEPYYMPIPEDYILEHHISSTSKHFHEKFEERHLVVRKDGTVLLMTSEELWKG